MVIFMCIWLLPWGNRQSKAVILDSSFKGCLSGTPRIPDLEPFQSQKPLESLIMHQHLHTVLFLAFNTQSNLN